MNKKDNIFVFFIFALILHLSLFFVKERGIKGEAPLNFKSNSAPISVKIKKSSIQKVEKKEIIPASPPKVEKDMEPKVEEVPKKNILQENIKSKIKDRKKENKPEKKNPKKEEKKEQRKENQKNIENSSSQKLEEEIFTSGNFSIGKDGSFIASSSEGIEYKILKQVEPNYPIQAEKIRYRKKVVVSVRFLVGLRGEVEKIEIIQSHQKFGFDEEVKKALNQWKFHPIYYKNKNIKVYFTKDFIFEPR